MTTQEKKALVVTSISKPNRVLKELALGAAKHGFDFYCIGDLKSPSDFSLEGCEFISHDTQLADSTYRLAALLPDNHYARKNYGYLKAIDSGVREIIETDDDNMPLEKFWSNYGPELRSELVESHDEWINAYQFYTEQLIWPRGFPLNRIKQDNKKVTTRISNVISPVQQSLANGDTDVDAIYRLVLSDEVTFDTRDHPLSLSQGQWCPFNSQSTLWHKCAFDLLYLPSYCSFRMTDIWRSFVVQACLWANGWNLSFNNASVFQARNEHNLMKDFEDEVPGYINNERIVEELSKLALRSGESHVLHNLVLCYEKLISLNLIQSKEEELIEAWVQDVSLIKQGNE